MKKFFAIAITGLFFSFLMVACGTGKAHCDAYGDATINVDSNELAENN